jgi:lipopolysaccharide transport system ATP-binding protein
MSKPAIRIVDLGKQYTIGRSRPGAYKTLRDSIVETLATPLRRLGQIVRGDAYGASILKGEIIWALRDINLEIQQGDVVGIIGHNGAGKSTLLKILSRITEPSTGYVDLYGRVGSLLEVGTGFHQELTGRENIYLNGSILGMSRADISRKFDEIVEFAGVDRFIDTPVKFYSTGMHLRLGFSVAAHLEPDILVVDEVLAVGDAEFQKKCLGKMSDVASEGRTVLFVSHNMSAISTLCTCAYWLSGGVVQETGSAVDVVRHYLGSGSVNITERDLSEHDDRDGTHRILQHVRLLHDENTVYKTLQPFGFEVECEVDPSQVRYGSVGYNIKNQDGRMICAGHLDQHTSLDSTVGSNFQVQAYVDQLPLLPGHYYLSLFFVSGSYNLDIVNAAVKFQVVWDEEINVVYPPKHDWGDIYLPVEWKIMGESYEDRR